MSCQSIAGLLAGLGLQGARITRIRPERAREGVHMIPIVAGLRFYLRF